MAARGDNIIRYIYRGEVGEIIPREATHISVAEDITFIRAEAFLDHPDIALADHPNIVEVICHDKVERIEREAFAGCPSLRRVIMPGVKIVEESAFNDCRVLTYVECGKMETIKRYAFRNCDSLSSINLPSTRIVEESTFWECVALTNVKFGSKLERIEGNAFVDCFSLERITIPLKDGLLTADNIFQCCENLNHVDLIEGELHETISSLHFEGWKNEASEVIDSINESLPNASAGYYDYDSVDEEIGEKAEVIRRWIRSVLHKIIRYQEEHQYILDEAAAILQHALPGDILTNNVLSLLALPAHTFEVEDVHSEPDEDSELEVE